MEDQDESLARRFEENRPHLRAVAYRMLGSLSEADDAVQETWLRLSRSGPGRIDNLTGWLTTVIARICLDMLRSRGARRDRPVGVRLADSVPDSEHAAGPEDEAMMADSVGLALLVVLDTLEPAERLAFVLHDVFAIPFDEIATIVDRSPTAARQLASRARRRLHPSAEAVDVDAARHRRVVAAFLAASRSGDFEGLLAVLDPGVVLRVDPRTALAGEIRGAAPVAGRARLYSNRSPFARLAMVDGAVGIVVAPRGRLQVAMRFEVEGERVVGIDVLTDPESLRNLELGLVAA